MHDRIAHLARRGLPEVVSLLEVVVADTRLQDVPDGGRATGEIAALNAVEGERRPLRL
jgi:hypothetical protein